MPRDAHRRPTARRSMTWLLRSPFSGLLDESVMLLTVQGRRTGTEYTLPVQYMEEGGTIWVFPGHHERKTWWRNLLDSSSVRLRLRGHQFDAVAQAFLGRANPSVAAEALAAYVRRFPAVGRRLGVLGKGGAIQAERLHEMAKSLVMVRILPTEQRRMQVENHEPSEGAPPPRLIGAIRRHPLGSFYALTFLLSWGYWVPDALSGGHLSHTPGLLAPMISSLGITAVTQGRAGVRDLFSRMVRWRVPVRWYLWTMAPLAVAIAVAAAMSSGPEGFPGLAKWGRMNGFPAIGAWAFGLILVVNAFGEEAGWRGYALPRFRRRHNELQASFLLFIPWVLWHSPTFFIDSGYRGFNLFFLPGFVLGIFAGAVVLTWMYEGARSSVLIVALWHLSLNVGSATKAGEGAPAAVVTMFVIVWSIFVSRGWHRRDQACQREEPERVAAPGAGKDALRGSDRLEV
jgi:CAAX protease family protein